MATPITNFDFFTFQQASEGQQTQELNVDWEAAWQALEELDSALFIDPQLLTLNPSLPNPPTTPEIISIDKHDFKMHTKAGYSIRYRCTLKGGQKSNWEHNKVALMVPDMVRTYWTTKSLANKSIFKLIQQPAYEIDQDLWLLMTSKKGT